MTDDLYHADLIAMLEDAVGHRLPVARRARTRSPG